MEETKKTRRWRVVGLLAIGVAIGVVLMATPAAAHIGSVTHLWNHHIKPKADARYDRVLAMQNGGVSGFSQTSYTAIASGTYKAAGQCALIMDGTTDWDDNASGNILFMQWFVDGNAVGGDFAFQGPGGGVEENQAASAIATKVVASGSHSVQLRARITSATADLEDVGAFAFCAHRTGSGAVVTPRPAARPSSGSRLDRTQ